MNDTTGTAAMVALIRTLPQEAAMLVAVEILLADPEALRNDALEGDLYILRDRLTAR